MIGRKNLNTSRWLVRKQTPGTEGAWGKGKQGVNSAPSFASVALEGEGGIGEWKPLYVSSSTVCIVHIFDANYFQAI